MYQTTRSVLLQIYLYQISINSRSLKGTSMKTTMVEIFVICIMLVYINFHRLLICTKIYSKLHT